MDSERSWIWGVSLEELEQWWMVDGKVADEDEVVGEKV